MIDTIKKAIFPSENKSVAFNDSDQTMDLVKIGNGQYNAIHQGIVYNIQVQSINKEHKKLLLIVNGVLKHIQLQDELDLRIDDMGFDNASEQEMKELLAPMPGLILDILVTEGAEICKGENILILEAMKMENILKAGQSRKVKKVLVHKGEKVEKNQKLLEFE